MREILETQRLLLRQPQKEDAAAMVPLANDFDVAKNLASMPFPYTLADARAFIARAADLRAKGTGYTFAVLRKSDGTLVGACGVHPERGHELGYWMGRPYWGQGFATEAARRVVRFAFEDLNAKKVIAGWYEDNPASGRVLEKLGFAHEKEEKRASVARGEHAVCRMMALTRASFARLEKTP
jgi:ribosomal-protein-alanine N-acetyltransferase